MFKTLRSRLLLFFLLITLVPLAIVSYLSYQTQKQDLTAQIDKTLFVYADGLAVAIKDMIQERVTDAKQFASNPLITSGKLTMDEIQAEMQRFLDVHEIYDGAIMLNSEGVVISDTDELVVGKDFSDRQWYIDALKEEVNFSDIYFSPAAHRIILSLGAAVSDSNGQIIGVISPSINIKFLAQRFESFSKQQHQLGMAATAFLINNKGDIISHPNMEKVLQENFLEENQLTLSQLTLLAEEKSTFENKENNTIHSFIKIENVPGFNHNWFVGIEIPVNELYEPLNHLLLKYVLMFIFVLFLTIFTIFRISASIVNPVQKLVHATSDFAIGKPIPQLKTGDYKEIDTLTKTFTGMTKALEERERHGRKSMLILETIDNGVLAFNKETLEITTFNHTCEYYFNIEKEKALGLTILTLMRRNLNFKAFIEQTPLFNMIQDGVESEKVEFECVINNEPHHFLTSIMILPKLSHEEEAEDILFVFNDLSEKREMEKQLINTEKLKAVGQLAASFAHEIRNPLTTIHGFMQLFHELEAKESEKKAHYELLLKEIERVNGIIQEMLDMANPRRTNEPKHVRIDTLINEVVLLFEQKAISSNVIIDVQIDETPYFLINDAKLRQVFMNIVKNAIEAMESGGELLIALTLDKKNQVMKIVFSDTGIGMSDETLKKVSTPFFTTKETGTGLGLMTSYRIIEELGGTIEVESEEEMGTTFILTIPFPSTVR